MRMTAASVWRMEALLAVVTLRAPGTTRQVKQYMIALCKSRRLKGAQNKTGSHPVAVYVHIRVAIFWDEQGVTIVSYCFVTTIKPYKD